MKKILAAIVIAGLLVGGGIFVYSKYQTPTPLNVAKKMVEAMSKVKSFAYAGEISGEAQGDSVPDLTSLLGGSKSKAKKPVKSTITLSGAIDFKDTDNIKGNHIINLDLGYLTPGLAVALEVLHSGKDAYLKLDKGGKIGMFDLSLITDQWVKIEGKTPIDETKEKTELTAEQKEKIKQAARDANLFKSFTKLADEKIDGVDTVHYQFVIDKEAIKNLVLETNKIKGEADLTEKELADLDLQLAMFDLTASDIWLGKKDYLPRKLIVAMQFNETAKSKLTGTATYTFSFKNYNEEVVVTVPVQSKSLEEVMMTMLLGGYAPTKLK